MNKTYLDEKVTDVIDNKTESTKNLKEENEETAENFSASAFSSEAEKIFKQNKFQKITGAIKKAFISPQQNANSKSDDYYFFLILVYLIQTIKLMFVQCRNES